MTSSKRELKHDIIPVNDDKALVEHVMNDIDKIKPSFYKYNGETDFMVAGKENKFRPMMHLGAILDESPDYIKDEAFSAIDNYGIATLALVGVKYNRGEIKEIKQVLGLGKNITVSDFGSSSLSGTELRIDFSEEFSKKINSGVIPVVAVTSSDPAVTLSVTEKTSTGFKIVSSKPVQTLAFDWIAMAKIQLDSQINTEDKFNSISPDLKNKLVVPEHTKQLLIDYYKNAKPTPSVIK